MNPMVIVRGVTGIALPVTLGAAYFKRRSFSWFRYREPEAPGSQVTEPEVPEDGAGKEGAPTYVVRQEVRQFLDHGRDLAGIDLRGADLSRFDLRKQNLSGLDLSRANLSSADLTGALLRGTTLDYAVLDRSTLTGADLRGASLRETSFWRADLRDADFSLCLGMAMANFRGATYNRATRWPADFAPRAAGAKLKAL